MATGYSSVVVKRIGCQTIVVICPLWWRPWENTMNQNWNINEGKITYQNIETSVYSHYIQLSSSYMQQQVLSPSKLELHIYKPKIFLWYDTVEISNCLLVRLPPWHHLYPYNVIHSQFFSYAFSSRSFTYDINDRERNCPINFQNKFSCVELLFS